MNRQLVLEKTKMVELKEKGLKKNSKMDIFKKKLKFQIFSFNDSHFNWLEQKTLAKDIGNVEKTKYNIDKTLKLLIKNNIDLKTGAQAPSSILQDLRDFSRYSSISEAFHKFLRPALNGLGKLGLDFTHLSTVFLLHLKIAATSFIVKILSPSNVITNHYIPYFFIILLNKIKAIKKIIRHYGILWVDTYFKLGI